MVLLLHVDSVSEPNAGDDLCDHLGATTGRAARRDGLHCVNSGLPTTTMTFTSRLKLIRRQRGQASIVHRATHGEVIKALPGMILDSEQRVHFVIEKTADPGGAHTGGFGFEIEYVPQDAALPEEMAIAPWFVHCDVELRNHPQRKTGIGADVLVAADQLRDVP